MEAISRLDLIQAGLDYAHLCEIEIEVIKFLEEQHSDFGNRQGEDSLQKVRHEKEELEKWING